MKIKTFLKQYLVVLFCLSLYSSISFSEETGIYLGALNEFLSILDKNNSLSESELSEIPFEVRNIALYRKNDRGNNKFSRAFYGAIEQTIINKLTALKRFKVKECFECTVTSVFLKQDKFVVMNQIDSSEGMQKIGKKIGVDSFMLWDAYLYNNQPIVGFRLFNIDTGAIVWSKQYKATIKIVEEPEWYSSLWNVDAIRSKSATGSADAKISQILSIGRRKIEQSSISNKLKFGLGAEFFFNAESSDDMSVWGIGGNAYTLYNIDSWFDQNETNYGNYHLFGSLGQLLGIDAASYTASTGLRIQFTRDLFFEVGLIYVDSYKDGQSSDSNFEKNAEINDTGILFTLGTKFK